MFTRCCKNLNTKSHRKIKINAFSNSNKKENKGYIIKKHENIVFISHIFILKSIDKNTVLAKVPTHAK